MSAATTDPPPRRPAARLTVRDRLLLAFLAEHHLVRTDHARALLGCALLTAQTRVRALRSAGYLHQTTIYDRQPPCLQITREGLAAIGSRLPAPRPGHAHFAHDVGVAWLWLAARDGAFGPVREAISERRMRSLDGPSGPVDASLGVRIGGLGPGGRERVHYPDLLLINPTGRRIAIELELTVKPRARREQILSAYAGDPAIDAVVYLVRDGRTGRPLIDTAQCLGASGLVDVQRVRFDDPTRPATPARETERRQARRRDDELSR